MMTEQFRARTKRDFFSWNPKSWIIGVTHDHSSKAYDWNQLVRKKVIQDSMGDLPMLLVIENDTTSYHVYERSVNGAVLKFQMQSRITRLSVDRHPFSMEHGWYLYRRLIERRKTCTRSGL